MCTDGALATSVTSEVKQGSGNKVYKCTIHFTTHTGSGLNKSKQKERGVSSQLYAKIALFSRNTGLFEIITKEKKSYTTVFSRKSLKNKLNSLPQRKQ